jgi:pyruvate-ferredoxin/flavodoxin oxidoreductase
LKDYAYNEVRYTALARTNSAEAEELLRMAQSVVTEKYHQYEDLAGREGTRFHPAAEKVGQSA